MDKEDRGLKDPEILRRIQEVETRIERMTEQGMADARQMVQQAREQAEHLLESRCREMEQRSVEWLREGVRAAEGEGDEIVEKARQEARELKERAASGIERAAGLVLRRVFPELSEDGSA